MKKLKKGKWKYENERNNEQKYERRVEVNAYEEKGRDANE